MNRDRAISPNIFVGTMDKDSDPHAISNADYLDASDIYNGYGALVGSVVFRKGNTLVSYTLPPAGTNKVLYCVEDKQSAQAIIFLHNSLGAHQIIAWRHQLTVAAIRVLASGSGLDFSGSPIHHAPVVDGKILYWADGNSYHGGMFGRSPKELDMVAGDNYQKNLTYEIYAGLAGEGQFEAGNEYTFALSNGAGVILTVLLTATGLEHNDPEAGLAWLETALKASILAPYLTFEFCECHLTIAVRYDLVPTGYTMLFFDAAEGDILSVGINHYPIPLQKYHVDLVKQPPHCAPTATYVTSELTTANNVIGLAAQFRVRYIYRSGARSAWSPISNVALNTDVDGEPLDLLNAIEVTFTDARLTDPSWLFLIRYVEVAFRDGNIDVFKLIDRFDVCKIGIQAQKIVFLNDKQYQSLESDDLSVSPDTQVLKLFDSVPLITGTMAVAADEEGNSLLFLGANLEGYDCPDCLDMIVDATPFEEECLMDISGSITVINNGAYPDDDINYSAYPLEGFVVYLAGTNYYAISDNPVDGSGTGRWTIENVPKGHYVLRVASYKVSFNNDLGVRYNLANGLEWQRTSAPVRDCAGALVNDRSPWERQLDLSAESGVFDLDIEAGYGTIEILNAHYSKRFSEVGTGEQVVNFYEMYLLDNEANNADADDRIGAINCERQNIHFNSNSLAELITDANGYAYKMEVYTKGSVTFDILITVENIDTVPLELVVYRGDYNNLYDDTLTDQTIGIPQSGGGGNFFIVNTDPLFSERKKALALFAEDANGDPVEGVLFIVTRTNRYGTTGADGTTQIVLYAQYDDDDRFDDDIILLYPGDACYQFYPLENPSLVYLPILGIGAEPGPWGIEPFIFTFLGGIVLGERYLKAGGVYDFGVVYEDDANRTCGVVKGPRLHVPFHVGGLTRYQMMWSITSLPPAWATHYRIVRTRNALHQTYVQWAVKEVLYMRIPSLLEDPITTTYAAGDYTHIFLRLFIPPVNETGPQLTFFWQQDGQAGYVPVEGDFVRLIMSDTGTPLSTDTKLLQAPVVGLHVDGDDIYAVVPAEFGALEIKPDFLIEYMTPRRNAEEVYYEGGEDCYKIGNPGLNERYHFGPLQDQVPTSGIPAQGMLTGGDTYWRRQLYTETGAYPTEQFTPNRLHTLPVEDIGRAFIYDPDAGQTYRYNSVRFSGKYVPNSRINDLSSFGSLDFKLINRQWGDIKWLGFSNNVLMAICKFKFQPLYVSKGKLMVLSGLSSVGRSDEIVEIADESVTDYGTHCPNSVVQENSYIYAWDGYQGCVVRYSQAGVQPITTKMVRYFRDMGQNRPDHELDLVLGGYDRRHAQYLLCFATPGKVPVVTLAYDEVKGGWNNRHSFIPEMMGRVGQELITFKTGQMYQHFVNSAYANYYGVQYKPLIQFVTNAEPGMVKVFWSMRILTDRLWAAPTITVPANSNYAAGMLSRLLVTKFQKIEGVLAADFLRDMLDTSKRFVDINASTNDPLRRATALLSGRHLRGEVMTITIQADNGALPTILQRVDVYYTPSDETNG